MVEAQLSDLKLTLAQALKIGGFDVDHPENDVHGSCASNSTSNKDVDGRLLNRSIAVRVRRVGVRIFWIGIYFWYKVQNHFNENTICTFYDKRIRKLIFIVLTVNQNKQIFIYVLYHILNLF